MVVTQEVRYRGVLRRLNQLLSVPHIPATLGEAEPASGHSPTASSPTLVPALPLRPGAPITWYLACHSCTRFRLSILIPFCVASAGYSGSGVPLGNMYLRPPPRITWAERVRAGGRGAWLAHCPLLTQPLGPPTRCVAMALMTVPSTPHRHKAPSPRAQAGVAHPLPSSPCPS